ncbi:ATP-binding protein [Streptomyces sp. NPDC046985]|uniref:ATP-binding protein n=1 Tax=Streptomyces sp. NPDC046985 TaxID=3155377 RepID=UPI0033F93BCC
MIPPPPLGTEATVDRLAPGAPTGAGPGGTAAGRRFRFELAAHPGSPAQARRLTRTRLSAWSVCEDICDTADLVVSELVTNAVVHTASSQIVCELHDGADSVRIAVRDEGCAPGEPHPSPQRPEEEHGRGLLLVEAMCRAWGAQQDGPGLVVWAELPRTAGVPHQAGPEAGHDDLPATGLGERPSPFAGDASRADRQASGDLGWGARPKPHTAPIPQPRPGGTEHPDAAEHGAVRDAPRLHAARAPHEPPRAHPPHGQREPHGPQDADEAHGPHGTGTVWL